MIRYPQFSRDDLQFDSGISVKAAKSGHSQSDDHSCFFLSI